jgi:hypothetical protein
MNTLTAAEMGFPADIRTFNLSVALKGGYPVGNVGDVSPRLQNITPEGETETVYQTKDEGKTWEPVGEFYKNKFDDWSYRWHE